jgi:hypothetical protein
VRSFKAEVRVRFAAIEVHDDIWLASFMDYDLGYFDLETRVLEPLENPFGPKVITKNHASKVGWIRWKGCHSPLNFPFKFYPALCLSATGRQCA